MSHNHRRSPRQDNGLHSDCFVENHYGDYRASEQSNSLRAAGATLGGGSETVILTLVFDEGQITDPTNRSVPQWGGAMPLINEQRRTYRSSNSGERKYGTMYRDRTSERRDYEGGVSDVDR